jgi:hypothetical protein
MPNSSPKITTRKNSSSFTLIDIQKLVSESEERLIAFLQKSIKESEERLVAHVDKRLDALATKIESIENSMAEVKGVQVQQEADIAKIKEIIVAQQHQIEAYEDRERCCNLMLSNIPEDNIVFENETLTTDFQKVRSLIQAICSDNNNIDSSDILEVKRIGKSGGTAPRLLKVCLEDIDHRNSILYCSRNLNRDSIRNSFGRVFINKDMSFLRRREEKRLRDAYRHLKGKYPDSARLRRGKLYLGQAIYDRIDFTNQLF